ncbi:hypothetical protein FHG64_00195 [Antarcticibacterium flavum]|uniref:DUF7793 domain-containing protein n=1 Tax=Antarcticibacterium flavum TaxID=2058175 RepID=A0A5B7WY22_9FLAO|nr:MULTISPECIES: hypothetical protein [Antarcticibacterium]MCM4160285.1 hypothetical protein [Antarcticibacterium sp. W02-3]QCY67940.1 hypothetical protein FHG64_00195 [Antarcticibacterium flavum]
MTEDIIKLDFGKVWFKDNVLIAELNEGILLDVEQNRKLLEMGKKAFSNRPYGYVSFRKNSYAVNPMVYLESASTTNLKAIAVVTTNETCRQNAILEKQFFKDRNSFEVFETLEEALNWLKFKVDI